MSDPKDESTRGRSESAPSPYPKGRVTRRQAIRHVVAGGGVVASSLALPKQWTKPIVEAIVSPAEGQVFSPPCSGIVRSFCCNEINPSSIIDSVICSEVSVLQTEISPPFSDCFDICDSGIPP